MLKVTVDGEAYAWLDQNGDTQEQVEACYDLYDLGEDTEHNVVLTATEYYGIITLGAFKIYSSR